MSVDRVKADFEKDAFPQAVGIRMLEVGTGYARAEMRVTPGLLNFHGLAHGGAIFTLADTAFGLAANTRGPAVAMQVSINYIRPGLVGALLVAEAVEEELTQRTGIYNVTVKDEKESKVALFRGIVFRMPSGGD